MLRVQALLGVDLLAAYIIWAFCRALVFIVMISGAIHWLTQDRKITAAYCGAHFGAIVGGCLIDVGLFLILPKEYLNVGFLEIVFVIPIFIFTGIALWICNWKRPVTLKDVFMPLMPIAAWGCLVIWGWQDMEETHVLGAWFVSAGSGGVELISLYGPEWATRRWLVTRLAGYGLILSAVYLILPLTV